MPLCAAFSVAAEPRKIARAIRRVTLRCPSVANRARIHPCGRGAAGAVDVGVDDRLEVVFQVLGQLAADSVGGQRYAARHDQRSRVVACHSA